MAVTKNVGGVQILYKMIFFLYQFYYLLLINVLFIIVLLIIYCIIDIIDIVALTNSLSIIMNIIYLTNVIYYGDGNEYFLYLLNLTFIFFFMKYLSLFF